ncbi:uncharacterized protein METZ01_LOCUS273399, partial [marine metagenome]
MIFSALFKDPTVMLQANFFSLTISLSTPSETSMFLTCFDRGYGGHSELIASWSPRISMHLATSEGSCGIGLGFCSFGFCRPSSNNLISCR